GGFNVPAGRYANPRICDPSHLRQVAAAFRRPDTTLDLAPFDHVLERAAPGDFLYFDPPYAPLSRTARFTSYTSDGFARDHHRQLRDVVVALAARGCHVVLSNSTAPEIVDLYEQNADVRRA